MWSDLAFIAAFTLTVILGQLFQLGGAPAVGVVLVAAVIAYRWSAGSRDHVTIAFMCALWLVDVLVGIGGFGVFAVQIAAWTVIVAWLTRRHTRVALTGAHRWVSIGVCAAVSAAVAASVQTTVYYAAAIALSVTGSGGNVPAVDVGRVVLVSWLPACLGIALSLWWVELKNATRRISEGAVRGAV